MTDTDDTHTALAREAQAEHLYRESCRLSRAATADEIGGPSYWAYGDSSNDDDETWTVIHLAWGSHPWASSIKLFRTDPDSEEHCPTREAARALATTRNTPPQQPHSLPDTAVTGSGEER